MARIVRHKDDSGHVLYRYPFFETMSDCDDRIICLSERSFNIILNSLAFADKMRTRVFSVQAGDLYTTVDDEEWGNFQYWVSEVRSQMGEYMACNEYLERIAIALEEANDQAEHQVINLSDLAEVLGIDPSEDTEDLLEAFQYLAQLFPGLPSLALPTIAIPAFIGQMRTNGAYLQLLRDMSISLRAQAVAQGGVDFASLYDTMGETADSLIVKAGWQGKAYWIWRWLSNDQIPGWAGWVSTISGLVLGSIRGATYDIADAIGLIDVSGIEDAIRDSTDQTIVHCGSCTVTQIYQVINDHHIQHVLAVIEVDATWPDPEEPPTHPDTEWTVTEEPDTTKCRGAKSIVNWLINLFAYEDWALETFDNLLTLANKWRVALSFFSPLLLPSPAITLIIGKTLAWLGIDGVDIYATISDELNSVKDELICALYEAETPGQAQSDFRAILESETDLHPLGVEIVMAIVNVNSVISLLFYTNTDIDSTLDAYGSDCSDCDEVEPGNYTVILGTDLGAEPGVSNPALVQAAPETGYSCITSLGYTINFHSPVSIDSISTYPGTGLNCGSDHPAHYYAGEDYTDLITTDDVLDPEVPITGVRCLYIILSDSEVVNVQVNFTPE